MYQRRCKVGWVCWVVGVWCVVVCCWVMLLCCCCVVAVLLLWCCCGVAVLLCVRVYDFFVKLSESLLNRFLVPTNGPSVLKDISSSPQRRVRRCLSAFMCFRRVKTPHVQEHAGGLKLGCGFVHIFVSCFLLFAWVVRLRKTTLARFATLALSATRRTSVKAHPHRSVSTRVGVCAFEQTLSCGFVWSARFFFGAASTISEPHSNGHM